MPSLISQRRTLHPGRGLFLWLALGLATTAIPAPVYAGVVRNADGWTDFIPSADTRIVYVSQSQGNDDFDGLSPETPLRSIARGLSLLRPGYPDWLLLRRGDAWTGQSFGYWAQQGGRSAEEPMVISYYGEMTQPRPLIRTGGESGMKVEGLNQPDHPDHRRVDYLALVGLHLTPNAYDGTLTDSWKIRPVGIRWFAGTEWALVEDCLIEGYGGNLTFQDGYTMSPRHVTVRRNVILDAWASDPVPLESRAQGIYVNGVRGLLIEENLFDHNGWKEESGDTGPDIFSHSMYIQSGNWECVVRGNISARASSHGLQLRPGGLIQQNLFLNDGIAMFNGEGDGDGSDNQTLDNVVIHGSRRYLAGDSAPGPRGFGISCQNLAGSECHRNIIAHGETGCRKALTELDGVTAQNNVVYNWGTSDPGPFPDPGRTIDSYDAAMGGTGSMPSFLAALRGQRRGAWNPAITAAPVVRYFQEGFGLRPVPPPEPFLDVSPSLRSDLLQDRLSFGFLLEENGLYRLEESPDLAVWSGCLGIAMQGGDASLEKLPGCLPEASYDNQPEMAGRRITFHRPTSSLPQGSLFWRVVREVEAVPYHPTQTTNSLSNN